MNNHQLIFLHRKGTLLALGVVVKLLFVCLFVCFTIEILRYTEIEWCNSFSVP